MATIVELDVRPYLRKKREPFQLIMERVNGLSKEEILLLHATFKPTPLLGLLKMKGFLNRVESAAPDHWMVAFAHKSQGKARLNEFDFAPYAAAPEAVLDEADEAEVPEEETFGRRENAPSTQAAEEGVTFLDNRGMQPPQPMVRTLKALERCQSGERVRIHNDRVPMFLIEELKTLGYAYEVDKQPDGSAKVTITKA